MIKRTNVKVHDLVPGMIIDQSIVNESGRELIARGHTLERGQIEALKKLGIQQVYISGGVAETHEEGVLRSEEPRVSAQAELVIEEITKEDRASVELSDSVKARVAEGVRYMFDNPASDETINMTSNIISDIMGNIMSNDAIAVDVDALKVCDEYTFKHSVDVATMAMIVAKKAGLPQSDIHDIGVAGLLHDIGKAQIPLEVLNKPGKLTDAEFDLMKKHSLFGYEIIKDKPDLTPLIKLGVLQHHEKINGKGYPNGIVQHQISPYARILTVVDIYDALVTARPYKKAFSKRDAVEMIMTMTDGLDVNAMKNFMHSVILYPVGSLVTLSNGEVCKVVENFTTSILRPKVVNIQTGQVHDLSNDLHCANLIIL
ncbi:MAG: HD-GYP domain-containing protein [Lachnospiraceae bacterium]|nr:HD-GYP domain-containing protein [Lachnospiraceae bacterium]